MRLLHATCMTGVGMTGPGLCLRARVVTAVVATSVFAIAGCDSRRFMSPIVTDDAGGAGIDGRADGDAVTGDPAGDGGDAGCSDGSGCGAPVPCGGATCVPGDYCVTRIGGTAPRCFPRADGGGCPAGTREGSCTVGAGPCVEITSNSSCSALSGCASADLCKCFCDFGGAQCGANTATHQVSCALP